MKKIILFLVLVGFVNAQAPAGYYSSANGLTGASLKTALSSIITNGHQDKGYNRLWTAYRTTDIDKNYENDGSILDIYSERPTATDPYKYTPGTNQCGTYSVEGNCYNREHIVPQSLFNEASPMKSDVHFIRATDGKVNGMRSNYPFGKVGTASFTSLNGSKLGNSVSSGYSGTVFEPIDEFKGDVARMIFYFVTRYQNQLSSFSSGNMLGGSAFPGLQTWQLNVLLGWHNQDPVSQAEINRNNASYTFQGNRNPFIDNPNYVNLIWGSGSGGTNPGTPNPGTTCVNETFGNIPTNSASSYSTRTWSNGGISWTATDSRTDQTISNKAITVRNGSLKSSMSSNGIGSLTVTTQLKFTGSNGTFNVKVNGVTVGTIPYNANVTTTTINNINVSGNVIVTLVNNSSSNRVAIDNLSWTCYSGTAKQGNSISSEMDLESKDTQIQIYPNPVSHQEIFVKGDIKNIKKAEIYNLQGSVMQIIDNPFSNNRNSIKIKKLEQGVYFLKLDHSTLKFVIK